MNEWLEKPCPYCDFPLSRAKVISSPLPHLVCYSCKAVWALRDGMLVPCEHPEVHLHWRELRWPYSNLFLNQRQYSIVSADQRKIIQQASRLLHSAPTTVQCSTVSRKPLARSGGTGRGQHRNKVLDKVPRRGIRSR